MQKTKPSNRQRETPMSSANMHKQEYVHLIPDAGIESLRLILGHPVYALLARSLNVYNKVVESLDFSIPFDKDKYCVIEGECDHTIEQEIVYGMIYVSVLDWPKYIARIRDNRMRRDMFGHHSTIHLDKSDAEVVSISILENRESIGSESVHYDHALVFAKANGYRFSIAFNQSATTTEFSDNKHLIESLLKGYKERLKLKHRKV